MTDTDFLHDVLKDGAWHGQAEILARSIAERGYGLTVHSRAADLRKRGLVVECELGRNGNGRALSFYRLVGSLDQPACSGREPGPAGSSSVSAPIASGKPLASVPPSAEETADTLPLFACVVDESAGLRGAYGDEAA